MTALYFVSAAMAYSAAASAAMVQRWVACGVIRRMATEGRAQVMGNEEYRRALRTRWSDAFREFVLSPWTLVFVVFFLLLSLADFSILLIILMAVGLAVAWGSVEHQRRRRTERWYSENAIGQKLWRHAALTALYWVLNILQWLGWALGAAFLSLVLAELVA